MSTLAAALLRSKRLYGEKPAIIDRERSWTWSEFCERVARTATVLQDHDVTRSSRFGILAANSFRQAELLNAGYWLAAIPVPINSRLAPPEIRDVLIAAGCRIVAVDPALRPLLDTTELANWRDRCLVLGTNDHELQISAAQPAMIADIAESSEALLLYTGGTSGQAKGVSLSHKNILSNALQVAFAWPPAPDDIALHVAPMFHSADLVMTSMTLRGAAHAYLPRFSPREFLRAVQDYRITITMLVPTMLILTIESGLIGEYDISSLRRILYGASPMPPQWIVRAMQSFPGVEFMHGYGLTETAPILTMLDFQSNVDAVADPGNARARSCGPPLAGVDLRIVDDSGGVLPAGGAGEIVVRGPNVFTGYLNLPEHNEVAFRGGWFHTGDVGMIDDNGYVYILDRKKDVIIVRGECIYSGDVESVLHQHPDVLEAAVIGVPVERYGESVFAVIVPRPNAALTRKGIRDFCRSRLGAFKIPTGVALVDSLPKSALGKVLKATLRQNYGGPARSRAGESGES